jgi:hypothetical protein
MLRVVVRQVKKEFYKYKKGELWIYMYCERYIRVW